MRLWKIIMNIFYSREKKIEDCEKNFRELIKLYRSILKENEYLKELSQKLK